MPMTEHDRIAVVDFGGQYAHLIATKVRRQRVLAEIRQPDDPVEAFEGMKGIILSGSPSLASGDEGGFNTRDPRSATSRSSASASATRKSRSATAAGSSTAGASTGPRGSR